VLSVALLHHCLQLSLPTCLHASLHAHRRASPAGRRGAGSAHPLSQWPTRPLRPACTASHSPARPLCNNCLGVSWLQPSGISTLITCVCVRALFFSRVLPCPHASPFPLVLETIHAALQGLLGVAIVPSAPPGRSPYARGRRRRGRSPVVHGRSLADGTAQDVCAGALCQRGAAACYSQQSVAVPQHFVESYWCRTQRSILSWRAVRAVCGAPLMFVIAARPTHAFSVSLARLCRLRFDRSEVFVYAEVYFEKKTKKRFPPKLAPARWPN
jgi:hypothetical protein